MKRKYSIVLFLIAGFLLSIVAHAQERDSSVIVSTENERVVQYGYRPTVFNIVATPELNGFTASEIDILFSFLMPASSSPPQQLLRERWSEAWSQMYRNGW